MYPGEYPQPLPRVSAVQCTITSGFAGARLSREDPIFFPGSGDADQSAITLHNTGLTSFTVQMKQTREESPPGNDSTGVPTGSRVNLGAAVALVPGGAKTLLVSPWMQFLEFYGTAGSGTLRAQIASRVRWQEMAFDKTETSIADSSLWNVKPVPLAPPPTL